jgi:hypothetical protein
MKFFTPELLEQFGSSDPTIANAGNAAWEEAGDRYEAYLAQVASMLPEGIRQIQTNYYLHDAVVFGMGRQENRFIIVLRLDTPPRDFLILTYDLLAEPQIQSDALPRAHRCATQVEWMYDELEVVPEEHGSCIQCILFSNGWEVRLRFRSLEVQQIHPILPLAGPLLPVSVAASMPRPA